MPSLASHYHLFHGLWFIFVLWVLLGFPVQFRSFVFLYFSVRVLFDYFCEYSTCHLPFTPSEPPWCFPSHPATLTCLQSAFSPGVPTFLSLSLFKRSLQLVGLSLGLGPPRALCVSQCLSSVISFCCQVDPLICLKLMFPFYLELLCLSASWVQPFTDRDNLFIFGLENSYLTSYLVILMVCTELLLHIFGILNISDMIRQSPFALMLLELLNHNSFGYI